jgi:hypothetical protein
VSTHIALAVGLSLAFGASAVALRDDRRTYLIPFGALMSVGMLVFVVLAWSRLLP